MMPHLNLFCFEQEITQQTKDELSRELTTVICQKLNVDEGVVSISLDMIPSQQWKDVIYKKFIGNKQDLLIKKPTY